MGVESCLQRLASMVWWEVDRQNKDWPSTQPYEYLDYNSFNEQSLTFDNYMIPEDDLELSQLHLLEVDNWIVIPAKIHLCMIITSVDVLNNWVVPSLGVKCDVVLGRLN